MNFGVSRFLGFLGFLVLGFWGFWFFGFLGFQVVGFKDSGFGFFWGFFFGFFLGVLGTKLLTGGSQVTGYGLRVTENRRRVCGI